MKTKKNFGAWMLDIFAAVMVTLFPTLCVKKYTKKSNKNAQKFLPGAEKEFELISDLGFNGEELKERVWSKETRIRLLERLNYALISDIQSEEELDVVLDRGFNQQVVAALKVYTPSKAKLEKMIHSLSQAKLEAIIRQIPLLFRPLSAWEVLGIEQDKSCKESGYWMYAKLLIEADPKKWAVPFMREVDKIPPSQRSEQVETIFRQGFDAAFELKLDLSSLIVEMSVVYPEMYTKILDNSQLYRDEDFYPYFREMFSQLMKYLDDSVDDIRFGCSDGADDEHWRYEAFRWLSIGYYKAKSPAYFTCLAEKLNVLKSRLSQKAFDQLCRRLLEVVPVAQKGDLLYQHLPAEYRPELFERMVELVTESKDSKYLLPYFPFAGQSKKLAARAILTLVRAKEFPVERLSELKENLQTVAIEEMEGLSQIEALRTGEESAITDLLTTTKLYPLAECYLVGDFEHTCSVSKYGENFLLYNEHFKLSDVAFKSMLHVMGCVSREGFVLPYAKKWGISKDLYYSLLGSNFSKVAPYVKKYIIAGGETAEQTEKTADETQVEVSEN